MIGFLLGLILSLIVITTVITATVKVFSHDSVQAKENFGQFIAEIEDLNYHGKPTVNKPVLKRNNNLILDPGTMMVYFDSPFLRVDVDAGKGLLDYSINFERPGLCEVDDDVVGCFCMFRDPVIGHNAGTTSIAKLNTDLTKLWVAPSKMSCTPIYFKVEYAYENCGVGIPEQVNSYTCDGGFMIERGVMEKVKSGHLKVVANYKNGRRINIVMENNFNVNQTVKLYKK